MLRGISRLTDTKINTYAVQSGTSGKVNGTVPKRHSNPPPHPPRPIMVATDSDMVHSPTV